VRLSMDEVRKQHDGIKKLYEQGLRGATASVEQVLDLFDTIEALQLENDRLNAAFDGLTEAINRLAEYEDSGLSPEEVQELAKAKADGRLVVLPCKVGDNVYFLLQDGEWYVSSPHRITEIGTRGFWTSAFPLEKPNAMDDFTSWDEFGKTVFLTKEEAERALERSGQDGCGEKE